MLLKKSKGLINLLFSIVLISSLIISSGCRNKVDIQSNVQEQGLQEETIVDMSGKEVVVPKEINKVIVTCYGGATHNLTVLGVGDKIVAQPSMEKFKQLLELKPEYENLSDVGSFDDINIEEILKLNPDVVIASITSEKGNSKIEETGIPVIRVLTGLTDVEEIKNEFMMLGQLFDKKETAQNIVAYWDRNLNKINERVSKISQENKKSVYYARNQMLETEGSEWWGDILITVSGGINVAHELGKERNISIEQLAVWDPEVILLSNVNSKKGGLITKDEIQNDVQLANLLAVKQSQLYTPPVGAFWWDRPSPDAILGFMWLAKTLYPTEFIDLDIKEETKNFYSQFYNYELTDEEVQSFLNPKA